MASNIDDLQLLDNINRVPQNLFGLESEAASESSSTTGGVESKKIWSDDEIRSKLKSGDLKEIENEKSKKEFWKRFKKIVTKDGGKLGLAKCKSCNSILRCGTSSSVLSRHSCNQSNSAFNKNPITNYLKKQSTTVVSAAAKTQFGKAIAYFCAKDMRPFEAVNGKGFRNLITETLNVGSEHGMLNVENLIPAPVTIRAHVAAIATEMREKLKKQIEPVYLQSGLAVTLDFWTDDYQKNPYLAITGHFIDEKWQLNDSLLGVYAWPVNLRQTWETIPTFLYEKLDEFGLMDHKKIIFVTDEGSNLKKSLENDTRLNCTAHILNTALKNVFEKESKLPSGQRSEINKALQALDSCKSLVTFIRSSRIKAQLLKTVVPDIDTRWHSKINMVESVLHAWDQIEDILLKRDRLPESKNDLDRLNNIDRTDLQMLFNIIEPFRKAILQLETSSKYPTLPLVVPVYQSLLKSLAPLDDEDEYGWAECLKNKLLESVKKKVLINQEHLIGTILHPSYRKLEIGCVKELEKHQAYNAIRDMILIDTSSGREDDNEENGASGPISSAKRPRIAADDLLDDFCTPDERDSNDELNNYLAASVTKISVTDVLEWWKGVGFVPHGGRWLLCN